MSPTIDDRSTGQERQHEPPALFVLGHLHADNAVLRRMPSIVTAPRRAPVPGHLPRGNGENLLTAGTTIRLSVRSRTDARIAARGPLANRIRRGDLRQREEREGDS